MKKGIIWLIRDYSYLLDDYLMTVTQREEGLLQPRHWYQARLVPAVTHPRMFRDCSDSCRWPSWLLVTAVTRPTVVYQHPSRARVPGLAPIFKLQQRHWYSASSAVTHPRLFRDCRDSSIHVTIETDRDCRDSSRHDSWSASCVRVRVGPGFRLGVVHECSSSTWV